MKRYDIETKDYHYGASMKEDECGDRVHIDDVNKMRRRMLAARCRLRAMVLWTKYVPFGDEQFLIDERNAERLERLAAALSGADE